MIEEQEQALDEKKRYLEEIKKNKKNMRFNKREEQLSFYEQLIKKLILIMLDKHNILTLLTLLI